MRPGINCQHFCSSRLLEQTINQRFESGLRVHFMIDCNLGAGRQTADNVAILMNSCKHCLYKIAVECKNCERPLSGPKRFQEVLGSVVMRREFQPKQEVTPTCFNLRSRELMQDFVFHSVGRRKCLPSIRERTHSSATTTSASSFGPRSFAPRILRAMLRKFF